MDDFYGKDIHKTLYGEHAMHVPCQMLLQQQARTPGGKYLTVALVIMATDEPVLSEQAMSEGCMHELIVGDMVVRPFGKWASKKFQGTGIAGLMTSEAMFPMGHEKQTLDNGYKPKSSS